MKKTKVSFNYKGKKFSFDVDVCPRLDWGFGLMFKSRNTRPLLFDIGKPTNMALTALFVFFPFVAIWLDSENRVLAVERINPFRPVISSPKYFVKLLEVPVNELHRKKLKLLLKTSLGNC